MRLLPSCVLVFFVVVIPSGAYAQQPVFTPVDINSAAEFPACGVIDVNKDGQPDIVSGGFWYEAPQWKKHFLREVEVIRGRFDDYSNLELDVNADGWTDIISVNFRSKSLFWLEHPGQKIKTDPESPWTKHVIDTPGPMETGRLHDVDGDGKLDILPNGADFAAWYEVVPGPEPKFIKHDLPKEIAGHGIGFGDVNGDGRGDIVGPKGWLEAPEDRRGGRWIWHPDWELHRDASIPILVHDVDGDGDGDLIYGRGHSYGLYWLEQSTSRRPGGTSAGATAGLPSSVGSPWTRHAIDTTWAQPHSLLLVDLNGDKQLDVVAGKRYMGHEGRDPGEWDLLCAYAYTFDRASRSWQRLKIHHAHRAGFGLDPRAADIDGDGDVDLVAADRCGLVLFRNEQKGRPLFIAPSHLPENNHQDPLTITDSTGTRPARSPAEYAIRRDRIQDDMKRAMGPLPEPSRRVPLDVRIESREETPDYVRIKLTYVPEPGDRVPALLLVPRSVALDTEGIRGKPKDGGGKSPAMLCLHPTNPDGKAQTAGLVGEPTRHYGHQLAQQGFVCLIPDYPSFGDYKAYDFKQKWPGSDEPLYASGTMKAIWNNIRAVDLLESLPYVDTENIGAIGHSLGGHNALYTAVFEPRIQAVVTSCGFNAFHDYYKGDLKGWTSDRYMPRIRDLFGNDPNKMPFDFPEVLAAIAPRAVYVAAPLHDGNFEVSGVRKCISAAQPVFELLGAKDKLVVEYPDCGHDFPDEVRGRVYQWLNAELK
ncbi:MAG: FG-GAP-like repeat-containing protein [Planctomycetes bacterium]|nr:FG-GAP-like repeat-containing protein [Planctomycetota bacterium]